MDLITIIWGAFVFIFISLGIYHIKESKNDISPFKFKEEIKSDFRREMPPGITTYSSIGDVDFNKFSAYIDRFTAYVDIFAGKFNSHIEYINKSNHDKHRLQAFGYFAASAMALVSLLLSIDIFCF